MLSRDSTCIGSYTTNDLIIQFFENIDRCLSQYRELSNYLHLCDQNVLEESDLVYYFL